MTTPTPRSRAGLCAQLAVEFPALDAETIGRAVDHAMQVAQELCGPSEDLAWGRAGVLARDHLDVAVHRARRLTGLPSAGLGNSGLGNSGLANSGLSDPGLAGAAPLAV